MTAFMHKTIFLTSTGNQKLKKAISMCLWPTFLTLIFRTQNKIIWKIQIIHFENIPIENGFRFSQIILISVYLV